MYRNLVKIIIFACLVLAFIIGITYYVEDREADNDKPTVTDTVKITEQALLSENIHGQIEYDTHSTLPAQSLLEIRLTSHIKDKPGSTEVAQIRKEITGEQPLQWELPVAIRDLDQNKVYFLQAKISSGDTLLFVNDGMQQITKDRSAYKMKLAKVDNAVSNSDEKKQIMGTDWSIATLMGQKINPESKINLRISNDPKTDQMDDKKIYHVSGFAGCNRYMGTATIDETNETMHFSALGTTFMACVPDVAELEKRFLGMMADVRFYQQDRSNTLYLLDSNKKRIAQFVTK